MSILVYVQFVYIQNTTSTTVMLKLLEIVLCIILHRHLWTTVWNCVYIGTFGRQSKSQLMLMLHITAFIHIYASQTEVSLFVKPTVL